MGNYYLYDGELYSADEIQHMMKGFSFKNHKYIKREPKGDGYRYYYDLAKKTGKGIAKALSSEDEKLTLERAQKDEDTFNNAYNSAKDRRNRISTEAYNYHGYAVPYGSYVKKELDPYTIWRSYGSFGDTNHGIVYNKQKDKERTKYIKAETQHKIKKHQAINDMNRAAKQLESAKTRTDKASADYERAKTIKGKTKAVSKVLSESGKAFVDHLFKKK